MFQISDISYSTKKDFYDDVISYAKGLMYEEKDKIANLANISALLYNIMEKINWVGFYLYKNSELVLGPFQGKPACIRIKMGTGVCGTAASSRKIQVVSNVHEYKGHIPCDSETNSEIVIPIILNDTLLGVLDIDSPMIDRFDCEDSEYLSKLIKLITDHCDWNE
ncbi:hypothetical protein SH1V18_34780 [Vallitalea longa]|uniref:GAF domain-containing protein n=1 Tax=Vallitalea longa TaxID=2936439 RepID=A0A9W5YES9_9FIRM|nr:GAF domain-containing protein [Vallitalea longa]GKX30998.1 hypothetical protein SH1V18_34780 [Vallitalea longa]